MRLFILTKKIKANKHLHSYNPLVFIVVHLHAVDVHALQNTSSWRCVVSGEPTVMGVPQWPVVQCSLREVWTVFVEQGLNVIGVRVFGLFEYVHVLEY